MNDAQLEFLCRKVERQTALLERIAVAVEKLASAVEPETPVRTRSGTDDEHPGYTRPAFLRT